MFGGGGQQQQPSSGYGTPQQPQQQGIYGGVGQQQSGYGTPNNNLFSSPAGFQSTAPTGLQQQTFSTSSPHLQQQQQQHPQQHQMMQQYNNGSNTQGMGYGQSQFGGSVGGQFQGGGGQLMMSSGGQFNQQPQQGAYGSPHQAVGNSMQGSSSGGNAPSAGVGRYLPGYLTASSLSGVSRQHESSARVAYSVLTEPCFVQSPRQSTSSSASNLDGRLSPEQSHRDTGSSFGAGSSRLFASSTSSAGTAGRDR